MERTGINGRRQGRTEIERLREALAGMLVNHETVGFPALGRPNLLSLRSPRKLVSRSQRLRAFVLRRMPAARPAPRRAWRRFGNDRLDGACPRSLEGKPCRPDRMTEPWANRLGLPEIVLGIATDLKNLREAKISIRDARAPRRTRARAFARGAIGD
jgi:hypothetical protein